MEVKMMKTNISWIKFLKDNNKNKAIYWGCDTRRCNMTTGTTILFLGRKNRKTDKNFTPKVYGKATYIGYEILTMTEAWNKYGTDNGVGSLNGFVERLMGIEKFEKENIDVKREIGCLLFEDVEFFNTPIILGDLGIEVKRGTVTYRKTTIEEYKTIMEVVGKEKYIIEDEEAKEIKKETEFKRYYEGSRKVTTITSKKPVRNKNLRKDYLNYLEEKYDGKVFCEICGQWEEIGEEMLQVHHLIEINGYKEKNKEYSTFDDVIAICPNCHRLIHIFENIEDVKKIYNKED